MVAITQSFLAILPLAVQIQGWRIVPLSDSNCMVDKDNKTAVDREEGIGGNAGKSSEGAFNWCMSDVSVIGSGQGIRSLEVGGDWDENCQIALWSYTECYDPDSTEKGEPPEQLEDESDEDYQEVLDAWEEGDHFTEPRKIFKLNPSWYHEDTETYCIPSVDAAMGMISNPPPLVDIVYDCEGTLKD